MRRAYTHRLWQFTFPSVFSNPSSPQLQGWVHPQPSTFPVLMVCLSVHRPPACGARVIRKKRCVRGHPMSTWAFFECCVPKHFLMHLEPRPESPRHPPPSSAALHKAQGNNSPVGCMHYSPAVHTHPCSGRHVSISKWGAQVSPPGDLS